VLHLTDKVPLLEPVDLRHPVFIILEFLEQFLISYDLDMNNTF
jgi:hypothetical protein